MYKPNDYILQHYVSAKKCWWLVKGWEKKLKIKINKKRKIKSCHQKREAKWCKFWLYEALLSVVSLSSSSSPTSPSSFPLTASSVPDMLETPHIYTTRAYIYIHANTCWHARKNIRNDNPTPIHLRPTSNKYTKCPNTINICRKPTCRRYLLLV